MINFSVSAYRTKGISIAGINMKLDLKIILVDDFLEVTFCYHLRNFKHYFWVIVTNLRFVEENII